eukprot:gene6235-6952_t
MNTIGNYSKYLGRKSSQLWQHASKCHKNAGVTLSQVRLLSDNENYLQRSSVPTMHFQPSLPRLPIPKLEDTSRRYLDAQKALLTPEQYEKAKKVTENFIGYEGRAINADLLAKDKNNKHTSYVSEPWFDMYLRYRDSIVLNHNPFLSFNPDPTTTDPLIRATKIIHSAMRFKKSLDNNLLEPDVYHLNPKKSDTKAFRRLVRLLPSRFSWYGAYMMKAFPLDMSQYNNLFNSTRIPAKEKDILRTHDTDKHIVVMRNGHVFSFDVINSDGSIVPKDEIHANLRKILDMSNTPAEHACGVLTSENRDTWAGLRTRLESDAKNAEILRKIDGAVFVACLDDHQCRDELEAMRMFLHGDGKNRWYDKSFQLIIDSNAETALHFEHSWGDGVAVMRFFNDIHLDTIGQTYEPGDALPGNLAKHEFNIDAGTKDAIGAAQKRFDDAVSRLLFHAHELEGLGKNNFKAMKVSPDAMMQLAFQMAYHRMFGCTAPTYESCSTAAFKHGRTETIRPATIATVACSEAFDKDNPANVKEMQQLLTNCSEMHGRLTKDAAMGQGFDRHLFAMKDIAQKSGRKVGFFEDEAYLKINKIMLSTSTVFSPNVRFGGFAPVIPNGLGVGYMISDDKVGCNVSAYPDSPNCKDFVETVILSLGHIKSVLEGRDFKE